MKPKHSELKGNSYRTKILDFANLYKSAAETNVNLLENDNVAEYKKKKKKSIDPSNIVVKDSKNNKKDKNNHKLYENQTDLKDIKDTAIKNKKRKNSVTINNSNKNNEDLQEKEVNVDESKSLPSGKKSSKNKNTHSPTEDVNSTNNSMNLCNMEKKIKPKKRNKSVSFVLEDNAVAVKKTKLNIQSNDVVSPNEMLIKPKKPKKKTKLKKECPENVLNDVSNAKTYKKANDPDDKENKPKAVIETSTNIENDQALKKKKPRRKSKKSIKDNEKAVNGENIETENKSYQKTEGKQSKKMKHHSQQQEEPDKADGEPVKKSRKKDDKPEVIANDLENLNIGDNTHTLTNLLDEMTVVDKKKKKRGRGKKKQEKHPSVDNTKAELATSVEKWNKRKWNKYKKGEYDQKTELTPVTVENLPIKIILNYKKLLMEHFSKCGGVRRVGIAEVYPSEDPKPAFTTTVYFESGDGAKKALEEDNTRFEGNVIRIKEYLPPNETFAVVRSYGELNDQIISSVFSEAGRIRRIRHMVKGKKSQDTAFVEFDGPEAVERAIKVAEETKIGGKNVHVAKYQIKPKKQKKKNNTLETEDEIESDGSNE